MIESWTEETITGVTYLYILELYVFLQIDDIERVNEISVIFQYLLLTGLSATPLQSQCERISK